jgi:hypothetical protein
MRANRYNDLVQNGGQLTPREQKEWHWCSSNYDHLIHISDSKFERCNCAAGRKIREEMKKDG